MPLRGASAKDGCWRRRASSGPFPPLLGFQRWLGALLTRLVCSRCARTSRLSWELLLLPVFPFITHRQPFPENPGSSPASLIDTKAGLAPCDVLSP